MRKDILKKKHERLLATAPYAYDHRRAKRHEDAGNNGCHGHKGTANRTPNEPIDETACGVLARLGRLLAHSQLGCGRVESLGHHWASVAHVIAQR